MSNNGMVIAADANSDPITSLIKQTVAEHPLAWARDQAVNNGKANEQLKKRRKPKETLKTVREVVGHVDVAQRASNLRELGMDDAAIAELTALDCEAPQPNVKARRKQERRHLQRSTIKTNFSGQSKKRVNCEVEAVNASDSDGFVNGDDDSDESIAGDLSNSPWESESVELASTMQHEVPKSGWSNSSEVLTNQNLKNEDEQPVQPVLSTTTWASVVRNTVPINLNSRPQILPEKCAVVDINIIPTQQTEAVTELFISKDHSCLNACCGQETHTESSMSSTSSGLSFTPDLSPVEQTQFTFGVIESDVGRKTVDWHLNDSQKADFAAFLDQAFLWQHSQTKRTVWHEGLCLNKSCNSNSTLID